MPWIIGGAILGSGIISGLGQHDTNVANIGEAQAQMDFQERMSNTAWQRGVTDMQAAGLNPMLAYMKGPAISPQGAMANLQNPSAAGVAGAASAAQGVSALSSAESSKAQADATRQEMGSFEQRMKKLGYETDTTWWEQQAAKYRAGILNSEDLESARYFTARARELTTKADLLHLDVPEAVANAAMWASDFGKGLPYVEHGLSAAGKALGLGRGVTIPRR